jgi:hypothetical protein
MGGIEAIKSHEFFEGIDFELIGKKGMEAPYKPEEVNETGDPYVGKEFN